MRPLRKLILAPLVLACLLASNAQAFTQKLAQPPSSILFENIIERSGIAFVLNNSVTSEKHQIETMTGGVAAFDYNNDRLLDIYFVNGARLPQMDKTDPAFHNRLYRNDGNGSFTDVTERAGVKGNAYAMGVAVGDYDNDGHSDLYVVGINRNQLFRNNGDGTFTDVAAPAGLLGVHPKYGKTYAVSAGWFDYNNDGFLDLLLINYLNWSLATAPPCTVKGVRAYCSPNSFAGLPNMLFRNNGDGTFSDISEASQIGKHIGKGMGVAFADYDGDGFTDVFVANDTFRNFLFRNNGDGTFAEVGILSGVAFNESGRSVAGMGVDFRDTDNDGRPDIFETAMVGDTFPLFRNIGEQFEDATNAARLTTTTIRLTAWGNGIFDFDNDGLKDLFTANGAILDNSQEIDNLPYKLANTVWRNAGDGTFTDVSAQAGKGFMIPAAHRGAAFGDFNNDGRIDIVTNNLNAKPELFLNRSAAPNNWLLINLIGAKSNRDGISARIKVTTARGTQHNHATTSVGYGSASDRRVHFGLGSARAADRVEIIWPSGTKRTLVNVKVNQFLTVREGGE
ncbi:MAG: CRTAC1 family protein [Acidobacteriota bacterium]|nr:CRTAC1 family protein [Acidobacteriota bacterium]